MPYDPDCTVLCVDEQPVQLIKEPRRSIPAMARRPKRTDFEYENAGTTYIFMTTRRGLADESPGRKLNPSTPSCECDGVRNSLSNHSEEASVA